MNVITLILLAVAPGIALTIFILLHDRYDKEPFSLLLKVFVFGMLATIPTMLVEMGLMYVNFFSGLFGILHTSVYRDRPHRRIFQAAGGYAVRAAASCF